MSHELPHQWAPGWVWRARIPHYPLLRRVSCQCIESSARRERECQTSRIKGIACLEFSYIVSQTSFCVPSCAAWTHGYCIEDAQQTTVGNDSRRPCLVSNSLTSTRSFSVDLGHGRGFPSCSAPPVWARRQLELEENSGGRKLGFVSIFFSQTWSWSWKLTFRIQLRTRYLHGVVNENNLQRCTHTSLFDFVIVFAYNLK